MNNPNELSGINTVCCLPKSWTACKSRWWKNY